MAAPSVVALCAASTGEKSMVTRATTVHLAREEIPGVEPARDDAGDGGAEQRRVAAETRRIARRIARAGLAESSSRRVGSFAAAFVAVSFVGSVAAAIVAVFRA